MRRRILIVAAAVAIASFATAAKAELKFQFDDSLTDGEREKLVTWISEVAAGVESLVGPFPFDVRIRLMRTRSNEPVPWANTLRGRTQGIRFYVDPRFSLDELRADWTAPHEMSHLILPYLGRENSWFAEGFASFMQHQVMYAMGVLDDASIAGRYRERLGAAERDYDYPNRPFVDMAPRLRAERKFPTMYWGGAVYFLRVNDALERRTQSNLLIVLDEYMRCCRRNRATLNDIVTQLDELAGDGVFFRRAFSLPIQTRIPALRRYQVQCDSPRYVSRITFGDTRFSKSVYAIRTSSVCEPALNAISSSSVSLSAT